MTWYDFRLKLHNMKTNINMNTLTKDEKEGIWVPSLVFSNTALCCYPNVKVEIRDSS